MAAAGYPTPGQRPVRRAVPTATADPYRWIVLRLFLQPRYAALSVLMLIVAGICTAAGVWQVVRLGEKIGANDDLRANAHAVAAPVAPSYRSLAGRAADHRRDQVPYGDSVRGLPRDRAGARAPRTVNSDTGYLVLTPLRTTTERRCSSFAVSCRPPSRQRHPDRRRAPEGPVDITARVQPAESRDDQFAALQNGQVESINAGQIAPSGRAVYNGYANLLSGQAGTDGLIAIPDPDCRTPPVVRSSPNTWPT